MGNFQAQNQHLLWRAGFGPSAGQMPAIVQTKPADLYKQLVANSSSKPVYLNPAGSVMQGFLMGLKDQQNSNADQQKKRELAKQSKSLIKDLNLGWLDEMTKTKAVLREKMALFWHGHFACRNLNVYFQQQLLHVIRSNALGNFGDLLMAVSKSPAMLAFLNNQQNRKSHPNENFAREVMELFTLGRGNYTEHDVKEAARAFTGWGFNVQGEFVFRNFQHDGGSKTVLGRTGSFDGEDVIKLILEQRQTAKFITRKLYRYLVHDVPDEQQVQWLAARFYQSGYDIQGLLQDIYTSDWFYEPKNMGNLVKSPVQLLVGLRRTLPMQLGNASVQLLLQRALGQVLLYPPNVAGWPGGYNWIDSSTLMLRLRLPQLLAGSDLGEVNAKTDDDQQMGMMETMIPGPTKGGNKGMGNRFKMQAVIDWEAYTAAYKPVERQQLYPVLQAYLLQTSVSPSLQAALQKAADNSSRPAYIQSLSLALMSTPEYQLC